MNREVAEKVANAVLYEGYMLYPYRRSAIKNRQRWTFGILYPPAYHEVVQGTERSSMHAECLIEANGDATIRIQFRFLQLVCVQGEIVGSNTTQLWDEAVERNAGFVFSTGERKKAFDFNFAGAVDTQTGPTKSLSRTQREVSGHVTITTELVRDGLWKLTLEIHNTTQITAQCDRNAALQYSLLSAHLILTADSGAFVSLLEPPDEFSDVARTCRNLGNLPVLIGNKGERDMVLCSPILLYDYPQVAPESAGDFFDATEMDEMLTLRVMTLTDEEKAEMRRADSTRDLLERTEQGARQQLMRTHGTIRSFRPVTEK